jgi:hypothetical protein
MRSNLNETYFVCKIEKLYPVTKELGEFIAHNIENLWSSYLWIYSTTNAQRAEFAEKWGPDHSRDYSANTPFSFIMPDGTSTKISHRDLFKKFSWLRTFTRAYINVMDNVRGAPDLHANNFMQRKDGTIVIIDPVWAGESPYQAYDRMARSEYDQYADFYDEEPEMVSGPSYLKKNQPKPKEKNEPDYYEDDPNMPF